MDYKIIEFLEHSNKNGSLVAIESFKEIPFSIKRVYYIYIIHLRMLLEVSMRIKSLSKLLFAYQAHVILCLMMEKKEFS